MRNSVWHAANVPFPAGKMLFQLKMDALHWLTGIAVLAVDCAVKVVLRAALH